MPQSCYPSRSLARTSTSGTSSSRDTMSSDRSQQTLKSMEIISSELFWPEPKSSSSFDIPLSDLRQPSDSFSSRNIPSTPHSKTSSETTRTFYNNPSKPQSNGREQNSIRRSNDDYRRYSGTVNHYGRHTNDWLFGSFSVREVVCGGFKKLYGNGKES